MSQYKETTGYIIHTRNFKNTSLIVEFFSENLGLLSLVAKGIKKNKKLKSQLQYFSLLKIQFFGKSQLKTLSAINILSGRHYKSLIENTSGMYLNELIHYSLTENEKAMGLFDCYSQSLNKLGKEKLTHILRNFEFELLKHNGFELSVDQFIYQDDWLTFNEVNGLEITKIHSLKLCKAIDLSNFIKGVLLDNTAQKRLNKLMLSMIDMNVSYRKIYSRELLKTLATTLKQ